jgi:hypothetical protein
MLPCTERLVAHLKERNNRLKAEDVEEALGYGKQ